MTERTLTPFQQALLDAQLEQWDDLPEKEIMDLQPSKEFDDNSKKLMEDARRGWVVRTSTTLRRIIIIAAILAMLAITALAIPAVREGIIRFFVTNAGTHYEFSFDSEQAASAPDKIEKVYKPTYIPEGFRQDTEIIERGIVCYIWLLEQKEYITFDQIPIPKNGDGVAPNAENVEKTILNWGGYQVFCVFSNSSRMYFWTDNEYFYALSFHISVATEEDYKVFSSISIDINAVIAE